METITNILVSAALIILSGLFSGLTLGFLGLDKEEVRRKAKIGDKYAKKIYPLRKNTHLLLTTLVLGNVAVNTSLSIFLGSITKGLIAGVTATILIVIFGELMPQALFSKFSMRISAHLSLFVRAMTLLLYPVAKPLAFALDKTIGQELPKKYSKEEFNAFLDEQKKKKGSDFDYNDIMLLKKSLAFSNKKVKDIMTPRISTFFLNKETDVDKSLITEIKRKGYSRIPVYSNTTDRIIGIVYVKDLIGCNIKGRKIKVKDIMRRKVHEIKESHNIDYVLNQFKKKRVHLFIVKDDFGGVSGIITLEDVLEELVGEIFDETDRIILKKKIGKK